MNVSRFYLLFVSGLLAISLIINFTFSQQIIINMFFYSFLLYLVISFYVVYSLFEINILQEKQGSKLLLSKSKLNSDWS